jgi:hypothetical protein
MRSDWKLLVDSYGRLEAVTERFHGRDFALTNAWCTWKSGALSIGMEIRPDT